VVKQTRFIIEWWNRHALSFLVREWKSIMGKSKI